MTVPLSKRPILASMLAVSLLVLVAPAASADRPSRRHNFVLSLRADTAATSTSSSCTAPATDLCTSYSLGKWRWNSLPVRYAVNPAGAPEGSVADVQDAFQTWEDETGSPAVEAAYPGDGSMIDYAFTGPTAIASSRNDGVNAVYFDRCDPSRCGAASVSLQTKGSTIVGFDMRFNLNAGWQTDVTCPLGGCGRYDLQNIATHEVGHTIALFHVAGEGDAMLTLYPGAARDEVHKRDLGAGDVLGVRAAYPA